MGIFTVSGYVTGRLYLIHIDFRMRDTPCPLDIARALSGPPISFPSAITHSNRALGRITRQHQNEAGSHTPTLSRYLTGALEMKRARANIVTSSTHHNERCSHA